MDGHTLRHLPPSWQDWLFASDWAFQPEAPGIVGLAWKSKQEGESQPTSPILHVLFVDSSTGQALHQDAYHWGGESMQDMQLWPGVTPQEWVLTWQTYRTASDPAYVLLCPMYCEAPLDSALPVVIDAVKERMTRAGPVIFVAATQQDIRAVRLRPFLDDTSPSFVRLSRVVKKHMREPRRSSFTTSLLEILWLGGTVQSAVIEDDALKVGVALAGNGWYLITFRAHYQDDEEFVIEDPDRGSRNVVERKPYWQLEMAGGPVPVPHKLGKLRWKHPFHLHIPASDDPYGSFMDDVIVGAVTIAGPAWKAARQEAQSTIVVAVGLLTKEAIGLPEEHARLLRGGELVCLSASGEVVQECKEELVEQVALCLVGETVVGVDRLQRRWRVWRWEPLGGRERFTTVRWLDEEVVQAHVVTNHDNSDPHGRRFWLVEERRKGLRVSRCDGQTLGETEPPLDLVGWGLPAVQERSVGHWDWPVKKGLIGHDNALVLIAVDEQNRMVLYRVEAGEGEREEV